MPRKYTKIEILSEKVFRRKEAGETNREIAESDGLTKYQIKEPLNKWRKQRISGKREWEYPETGC